ncbi:hypothetical protein [Granulicella mallensis]|uniref:Uncharacterized protein n=1 Tax=Granulicella mallensis TaxID=940614 RepID=A0A7W8EC74_9BACT|nr:hypothetical protein [Granulicella mallensis]MBB5066602.1 hypothetical protein [Granulicella mallensis]
MRFATLDDTVLNQWCSYAKSCYGTKTPADLKIAYLSGSEPENDLIVLLDLGIDIANVWAFEQEASLYKAALAKAHALHPSLKVYPGKIETFAASSNMRFDIIYLDFTGALFSAASKPFRALHGILENHALSTLGVLIVNTAEPEQTPDSVDLLARYFQNQLWVEATVYGEKRADGSPIEHYVEGPDSYGFELQKLKSLVEENFGAAYSAFATQYPALYANYIQPAPGVMSDTVAKKRFFNPDQKAMNAEIDRFSNADAFLFIFLAIKLQQTSIQRRGTSNWALTCCYPLTTIPCSISCWDYRRTTERTRGRCSGFS